MLAYTGDMHKNLAVTLLALSCACLPAAAQNLKYPETKRMDHIDAYFGEKVADPYRWLEDENAAETAKWVEAENKVTFAYLDKIPYRQQIKARLEKLYNYVRYGVPFRNGDYFFFSKNDGLQNQSVYYIQKGITGAAEILIDPNKFSPDGTSQLAGFALSKTGKYLGYGISEGGSDWHELHVMEVQSRSVLKDVLYWVKVSSIAWQGDGFYYSRYDEPKKGKELTSSNDDHKVFYHHVGTTQDQDELVYEDKANPQRFHTVTTTEDERFAILDISDRGKGKKGNALYLRDRTKTSQNWTPLVAEIGDDEYHVVNNIGDKLLVQTNHNAPNWKVVLIDTGNPAEKNWKDLVPEKPEPLDNVGTAGGKLFVTYLKDVTSRAYVYDMSGKLENEITLPGPGTLGALDGKQDDKFIFYSFVSFSIPTSIYKYDISTRKSTLYRAPEIPGFKADDYETKQVFLPSKDGTKIPMFIVNKKGIKLDASNPTLMYGYGGFNITTAPGFNSLRLALLEQ